MKKYAVIVSNTTDGWIALETDNLEEAKAEARDQQYYIDRDGRKGEDVELVVISEWESGNYNPIDFKED